MSVMPVSRALGVCAGQRVREGGLAHYRDGGIFCIVRAADLHVYHLRTVIGWGVAHSECADGNKSRIVAGQRVREQ